MLTGAWSPSHCTPAKLNSPAVPLQPLDPCAQGLVLRAILAVPFEFYLRAGQIWESLLNNPEKNYPYRRIFKEVCIVLPIKSIFLYSQHQWSSASEQQRWQRLNIPTGASQRTERLSICICITSPVQRLLCSKSLKNALQVTGKFYI